MRSVCGPSPSKPARSRTWLPPDRLSPLRTADRGHHGRTGRAPAARSASWHAGAGPGFSRQHPPHFVWFVTCGLHPDLEELAAARDFRSTTFPMRDPFRGVLVRQGLGGGATGTVIVPLCALTRSSLGPLEGTGSHHEHQTSSCGVHIDCDRHVHPRRHHPSSSRIGRVSHPSIRVAVRL
jgi:hypothetical protein